MRLFRLSLTVCAFALPVVALAQPRQLTAADYARAEAMLGANTSALVSGTAGRATWLPDGRLYYRAASAEGAEFVLVNPARRTRAAAFDHARLATALSTAIGMAMDGTRLPFSTIELSPDARLLTASVRGASYNCDLRTYNCVKAPASTRLDAPRNSSVSPDGSYAVFIREYNLWGKDLVSGEEVQLTTDGIKDFGYATNNAGWVHNDNPVVSWSSDSRRIATFQHDGRGVTDMHLVSTNVGNPQLQSWKYPVPGDSVIFRISRVVIDRSAAAGSRVTRLQMPPDAHRSTVSDHVACGGAVCDLQWFDNDTKVAFISSSRDHKTATLRIADATTGVVRTVLEEKSETQVGDASLAENLWRVLPASNELIWWSQRDNWVHLYLYDLTTGQLKNRITTGTGNVTELMHVDEKSKQIWFTAVGKEDGRDPYFQHFYRIGFDGRNQLLLTSEVSHHAVSLSPDARYFTDTYSTPNTPPVMSVRDANNGRVLRELERTDISRLVASGWKPPMPVTMKARDGTTDIYGLLFTPKNMDSTRKYPIINYIYPGPQSGSVGTRSFTPSRSDHQALAELGFVVVAIDGMGTPGRSKEFHDAYYGRMGDNTIPDQVAGMKELASRYAFIDIDKAGMWGHSGGGFATAAAMFRAPDFFKVGISESGNHDNRNYEDDWGERYQGLLVKNGDTDNYAAEANQTYASNLTGKLFLIHGMMDDNVPPSNTLLVADALMKAGKDFDLLMLPNARHGFGADGPYIMRRRWDYFVQHLQGNIPPKEYQIGRPRQP